MKKTNLFIFDGQSEQLLTVLSNEDNNMSPFWEAPIEENLNGDFIFEFKAPINDSLVEGNLVAFEDMDGNFQLFQIYKANKYHIDGQVNVHVWCEHSFYELSDDIVEDLRIDGGTAQEAMTKALSASRWQVGQVDNLGTGTVNFYYQNATKSLQDIVATFGGELRYRVTISGNQITGRFVDLLTRRGSDTGKRFEYTKDLVEVNRTVQVDGLKTALYGRGSGDQLDTGGYSRKTTFADVVWSKANGDPVDKPAGQEWVGDPDALAKWGRANGTRHRFGIFYVDSTDPFEILNQTWQELQRVSTPNVTYELKVIDLEKIAGLDHEKVRIGDTVYVIDNDLDMRMEARVMKITYNLDDPENSEVILGNFIEDITTYNKKLEEVQAKLTDRQGVWDKADTALHTVDDSNIVSEVPAVPANVSAQGLFKSIILSWTFDPSIKTSAYEVYASKVQGFTVDSTNLVFRGKSGGFILDADTNETWYFRLRALNPTGQASAYTQEFSASTIQIATPDFEDLSVTNAKIHDVSADKMTVGTLDANKVEVININADNINTGVLDAKYIHIGTGTTFDSGYDPTTKATPSDVSTAKQEAIDTASSDATSKANTAEQNAKDYTDSQLTNYVDVTTYNQDISDIQNQIDGNITSWFYDYDPTLSNAPANTWVTNSDKDKHIGDLFYNTMTGYGWRFAKDSSTGAYSWIQVKDTDIQKALADASTAQDTADQKRRVFVTTPVPPYDAGDLWTNGQTVYRATVAKGNGASFAQSDWTLVGDVTANNKSADTAKVNGTDGSTVVSNASAGKSANDKIKADVGSGTIETTSGSQSKANTAESNAKNYASPAVVQVYDAGFVNSKAFWSDSYTGQTVTPTTKGTINASTEAQVGGNVWDFTEETWLYSLNPIPVDVNRTYRVTFRVRQTADPTTSGTSNVYAGVATLDKNFNNITGGAGTHRYCAVAGTTIQVSDGWQIFEGTISGVGDTHQNFRDGTVYIRPMFIVNYKSGTGTAEVDFIKFEDVTEIQQLQDTVTTVDLRTTDSAIIATVRNSAEYANDLKAKADSTDLANYASTDDLNQAIQDANDYTDQQIQAIDFSPYVTQSEFTQTNDDITAKFQATGGVNMLKNSVGFAGKNFWEEVYSDHSEYSLTDDSLEAMGFVSGFHFPVNANNKGIKQTVNVTAGQPYTLSWFLNKTTSGSDQSYRFWIQIQDNGVTVMNAPDNSGTKTNGYEFGTMTYTPTSNNITVRFIAYPNCEATVTGIMLNVGELPLQWSLAVGEVYNTSVQFDLNGIKVNNNVYNGYTVMSPEEFAGYAEVPDDNNNLVMTKVFTLNKDVTEVSKLQADKQIDMAPIKIVPVTGTYNGWAFIAD